MLKNYVSEESSTKDVKISVTNNRTQPSSVLWLISVMGNIVGILAYLFIYLFIKFCKCNEFSKCAQKIYYFYYYHYYYL